MIECLPQGCFADRTNSEVTQNRLGLPQVGWPQLNLAWDYFRDGPQYSESHICGHALVVLWFTVSPLARLHLSESVWLVVFVYLDLIDESDKMESAFDSGGNVRFVDRSRQHRVERKPGGEILAPLAMLRGVVEELSRGRLTDGADNKSARGKTLRPDFQERLVDWREQYVDGRLLVGCD